MITRSLPLILRRLASVKIQPRSLAVIWPNKQQHEFSFPWLRDHCHCSECRHTTTHQRLIDTATIPTNLHPESASVTNNEVSVRWGHDRHVSTYPLQWLQERVAPAKDLGRGEEQTWGSELTEALPLVEYAEVVRDDAGLLKWLNLIDKYGVAFVRGVEPTIEATKSLLLRIGCIQETIFGGFWAFSDARMDAADTAYTNMRLGAHTDGTYFSQPSGLQSLHCYDYRATGGQSLLVDGFRVTDQLRALHPESFRYFSTKLLPFHYRDDAQKHDLRSMARVIELDSADRVKAFRYNNDDRAVLNMCASEADEFYEHLRHLLAVIRKPENECRPQLLPGLVMTFNNRRVLHGRETFTGIRKMCGSYHTEDDWRSRLRWLRGNQK